MEILRESIISCVDIPRYIWVVSDKTKGKPSKPSKQGLHEIQLRKGQQGRPRIHTHETDKSSQDGLYRGWTRATFIIREDLLKKLKAVAYWARRNIKDVIEEVLELYLKGKKVKPIPKKGRK